MAKIAVISVRGVVNAKGEMIDTLKMLKLHRKNVLAVFNKTDATLGMIKKVKDYVTYGEIDDAFDKMLAEKRPDDYAKGFFRLSPPKGGFERKGIKKAFTIGGALGYRGDKMKDLIKRMM
jgi:large subunit ribosomal protein L30